MFVDSGHSPLSTLLSLSNDAILLVRDGELVFCNEAADKLLQIKTCPEHQPSLLEQLRKISQEPADNDKPHSLILADGTSFHATVKFSPVEPSGSMLHVITDLSHLQQTRIALEASNKELKAMARRLFSAQEDERRAISRDLHDDIGQTITAMRMSAHAAMDEEDAEKRKDDLMHLLELADQAVSRLRDLSMLLRPPQLDALGLESALRWQADLILKKSHIKLQSDIQPLVARLDREIEQACFRIAQEAITNIVRHSKAENASLTLRCTDKNELCLVISDDGIGFDASHQPGLGLVVMRERAQAAGGNLLMSTSRDGGTLIYCKLPCKAPKQP